MQKQINKTVSYTIDDFDGLDLRCPKDKETSVNSVNFRSMPDGSLKKREGIRSVVELPDKPSGFTVASLGSEENGYAVIGNKIYSVDLDKGTYTAMNFELDSVPEHAELITFEDLLFILDGHTISKITDNGAVCLEGYIPLYGSGWDALDTEGYIYEAKNLLSPRIRINYSIRDNHTVIHLPIDIIGIDRVDVNGHKINASEYFFDSTNKTLESKQFSNGYSVTVWMRYMNQPQSAELVACTGCAVAYNKEKPVLFLYNPDATGSAKIYRSVPVRRTMLSLALKGAPNICSLYFPDNNAFTVGNGNKPITKILPIEERVVVFNKDEAWIVTAEEEQPSPKLLRRGVGCSSRNGCAYCGEYPVTVYSNGVCIWQPDLESFNELSAVSISDEISGLMTPQLTSNMCIISEPLSGELWMFDPTDPKTPILIYERKEKRWSMFNGLSPDYAFIHNGKLGFIVDDLICISDSSQGADIANGVSTPIAATRECGWLDLGLPGIQKRAEKLILTADTGGNDISVTLEFDRSKPVSYTFRGKRSDGVPEVFIRKLPNKKFLQLKISLSTSGKSLQRIYGVTVDAVISDNRKELK